MRRSAQYESLGGCLRPWRDGRMRALLAHIQRLRGPRTSVAVVPGFRSISTSPLDFPKVPKPWVDDRLKQLVAHIGRLRSLGLYGPVRLHRPSGS